MEYGLSQYQSPALIPAISITGKRADRNKKRTISIAGLFFLIFFDKIWGSLK
jgi:hypothetical protein